VVTDVSERRFDSISCAQKWELRSVESLRTKTPRIVTYAMETAHVTTPCYTLPLGSDGFDRQTPLI
jgi:hypothetical protein